MTAISKSIVANTVSKAIIGVLNIVVIPFYVHYLGMEAYGLVGFYGLLLVLLNVLDLGFSTTLTRSLSQLSLQPEKARDSRNLARTLELAYWTISIVASSLIFLVAPFFVNKGSSIDPITVHRALGLMSVTLLFQFPVGLYTAGLVGLQRQVEQSVVNAFFWVVRCIGALLLLRYFSTSILAFFSWQALASVVSVVSMGGVFWYFMPRSVEKTRPGIEYVRSIARYATGMSLITILLLFFHHCDKAIISWRLPLIDLGYYTTASQVSGSLFLLYMPINTAYFPVFAQKLALSDRMGLKQAFHRSCQLMSVFILPFACLVTVFAPEVLTVWLHDPQIVERVTPLVRLLVPGATAGALANIPWAVQLAKGRFKEGIAVVLVSIAIIVPALIFLTGIYGIWGGALSWMLMASLLAASLLVVVYRTTLRGEWYRWITVDVGRPLVMSLVAVFGARALWVSSFGTLQTLLGLLSVYLLALVPSALSVPALSVYAKRLINRKI
jgi:O-antigen/teichoic acid export membrane protein